MIKNLEKKMNIEQETVAIDKTISFGKKPLSLKKLLK